MGANSAAVLQYWQQQQTAAEARQKEQERQARLQQGVNSINALFDGTPIMESTAVTGMIGDSLGADGVWNGPSGYSYRTKTSETNNNNTIQNPNAGRGGGWNPSISPDPFYGFQGNGYGFDPDRGQFPNVPSQGAGYGGGGGGTIVPTTVNGKTLYQLVGPDGTVVAEAATLDELRKMQYSYSTQKPTGQYTGGIGQDFYDNYGKAIIDYYAPEIDKQFKDARDQTTFAHARSGTLQSSAANQNLADLLYQKDQNTAALNSKADAAKGELRTRVANEKSSLINQLYATENPDIAANEATGRLKALANPTSELSPAGDLFKLAAVGAGEFLGNYTSPYNRVSSGGGLPRSTGRTV